MEEEERGEIFQAPTQFESSRLNKQDSGRSPKKIFIIIFVVIVLALIVFGVFKFISGSSSDTASDLTPTPTEELFPTEEATPTEEMTPTEEPKDTVTTTPSPKPTSSTTIDRTTGLDRSKLAIHVLNGSGTAGASKTAGDYLTGLGWNVIQVGNAENFDYTNASIQIKSSQNKYLNLLKSDLAGKYTVGSTSANLDASGRDDAVVIIGK